ncbi:hypothetical protein Trydic_g306 [Trypoxylus dichotomus]
MSVFMRSENSLVSNNESKHYNMKQFINAVHEYANTRTEETANLINRHLQLLSVTIDLSIFDPHTSVVSEFFVSLHELLSNLEPRAALAWCCVNVLGTCCRNSAARNALIHTYEFIPPLSRLLGDQLPVEKKIRLLTLMQELTCGIRISWQIPHLRHLMSTLTRWINTEVKRNNEVVSLSLGVLVNLCYKNLPAIYTLTKCVDIKSFIRATSALEGIEVEVHVCKLLIILDHMYGKVPLESLIKLTEVTFKSMIEAFKARNSILLRHIIEFFLDIKMQDGRRNFIMHYEQCDSEVLKLLDSIENNLMCAGDTGEHDPECMSLVLTFLHSLVELRLSKLVPFYERLVRVSLRWLQSEVVSTQALVILRTIALQDVGANILEPILNVNNSLSLLLLELEHKTDEIPTNLEYNMKLSSLMELLLSLLKIFSPILGDRTPRQRANDVDTTSKEAITLYTISLTLIYELSKYAEVWEKMYSCLIQQKQIHMVLAQGFYGGTAHIRSFILGLASSRNFPKDSIAAAMVEIQPVIQLETKPESNHHHTDSFYIPTMSVAQSEKLEEVLSKLREAVNQNNLLNSATSDVMELYEYKLASMGHAERAAMASVEAASQRCTHLQHRIAQLTAELSRTHQLLFHSQQCQGDLTKDRDSLLERNKELANRLEAEKGRSKAVTSQLLIKEKFLQEKEQMVEETSKRLKEIEAVRISLDEQNGVLKSVISKLELNLGKMEKAYKKKDEMLASANANVDHMKPQITQLEKQLLQTQADLTMKTEQLAEVTSELSTKKQIIDTITKLTNSNR